MEEFDENKAVKLMIEASGMKASDELSDTALEVLDLIYDYYEEHGELDINADEEDEDAQPKAITEYIQKQFKKNAPTVILEAETIEKMVLAEIEYEDSLI